MNAQLRRRLEMAERVREFLRAHKTDGVGEGLGLAKRGIAAARGRTCGAAASRFGGEAGGHEAAEGFTWCVAPHAVALSAGGGRGRGEGERGAGGTVPDAALHASHKALIEMARGMLEKATAHKDVLVQNGMSEQLLDDLSTTVGEFEQTVGASLAAKRAHIGATADLWAVTSEITEQLKLLEGLVRYRFGEDAELMGAWAAARNVLGPFKTKNEPEAAGRQTPKAA